MSTQQGSDTTGRRDPKARISYFDPANQATIDRLISTGPMEVEGEEENTQATMTNVEEMIENYEWASDSIINQKSAGGAADLIEARLIDELVALEKVRISHLVSFLLKCNLT
jgi:exocyst complex component 1